MKVITRDLPSDYFTIRGRLWQPSHQTVKYFCATDRHGDDYMVIFTPGYGLHKDVFEGFGFKTAISAGYINYEDEIGFYCYGESTSMNVSARKDADTKILTDWIKAS